MIPEKVTWVRSPTRINTIYSKLPPVNDLLSTFLIKHSYLPQIFLQNIIRKFFLLCCIRIQFVKFFNFSPNFLHSFTRILPFQEELYFRLYFKSCKLVIFNSQINVSPFCTHFRNILVPSYIYFSTIFLYTTRIRPQLSKLLIFSRFSRFKMA